MPTWKDFATESPELANFAFERLDERLAYLATVRATGAPRVHPVSPFIDSGHLFVYMEPDSPKARDLVRDPRYALHCAVEDNDGGEGELSVSGRARLVPDPDERAAVFSAARAAGHSPRNATWSLSWKSSGSWPPLTPAESRTAGAGRTAPSGWP